jgi:hypothetical protein
MEKATRPHILVLPPPSLYRKLFSPRPTPACASSARSRYNGDERDLTSADLAERIGPPTSQSPAGAARSLPKTCSRTRLD